MSEENHNHSHAEDDFSMAFLDSCDRLPLLLIHGFPLNATLWSPQMDDLANYARVIAPDLRGHGNSDAVPGPYSVEMLADDCADLLDYLAVSTPFVVCGLSMGGYVALEMMRRYPESIAGLILTATRAAPDTAEGKANRDKVAADVRANGIEGLVNGMTPKLVSPKTAASDPELMEIVHEMMMRTSVEGTIGALMAMRDRPDSTPSLADIDVPTLIIHGEDDQIVPPAEAKAMADAIKNAKLIMLPDAGHLPNLEQPDEFNDAVIDFLQMVEDGLLGEE